MARVRARLRRTDEPAPELLEIGDLVDRRRRPLGPPRRRADRAHPARVRPAGRAGPQAVAGVHPRGAAGAGLGLPARGRHPAGQRARPAAAVQDREGPRATRDRRDRARRRLQGRARPEPVARTDGAGAAAAVALAGDAGRSWRRSLQLRVVCADAVLAAGCVVVCSAGRCCTGHRGRLLDAGSRSAIRSTRPAGAAERRTRVPWQTRPATSVRAVRPGPTQRARRPSRPVRSPCSRRLGNPAGRSRTAGRARSQQLPRRRRTRVCAQRQSSTPAGHRRAATDGVRLAAAPVSWWHRVPRRRAVRRSPVRR